MERYRTALRATESILLKLEPLKTKTNDELASDPYLKDIVECNLEVAAQACDERQLFFLVNDNYFSRFPIVAQTSVKG